MRDTKVDILRFIGLAMIIFAHVNPPLVLFNLRNFDVPLMVLVSAMSFGLSYKATQSYFLYLWKRLKRLAFPVWIFLTGYFAVHVMLLPESDILQLGTIADSYALIGGIGYVWIIRVFLLVAMVSPFIYCWHQGVTSNRYFFTLLGVIIIAFEVLRYFSFPYIHEGLFKYLGGIVTHYVIPYGVVFAIGLRLPLLSKSQVLTLSFVSMLVFVLIAVWLFFQSGQFVPSQAFKYPPGIYYISYALAVSCFLLVICDQIEKLLNALFLMPFVLFCAQNSIWIYLWHIPFVTYIDAHFTLTYVAVFTFAVIITYVQVQLVSMLIGRMTSDGLKKNIKLLLTG